MHRLPISSAHQLMSGGLPLCPNPTNSPHSSALRVRGIACRSRCLPASLPLSGPSQAQTSWSAAGLLPY